MASQPAAGTPLDTTPLDDYVALQDDNYTYRFDSTISGTGYTAYVLDMTSQKWRSSVEVDPNIWHHWLTIIVPNTVNSNKALLFVSGGSINNPAPTSADPFLVGIATATNSVVALLKQVPNERLKFSDEFDSRYVENGRTEDEIISYTFDKFLRTGDGTWPLLLPMVKSAVRAMDTVQDYVRTIPGRSLNVSQFVVSGASKRGWTTWLTAAVDPRVVAIAPMVIDLLNINESMTHHRRVYEGVTVGVVGGYSEAIVDYVDMHIFDRMNTKQGVALVDFVDPYEYRDRDRYASIPKFGINGAVDECSVPHSAQFYCDDLPREKYLQYIPNVGHSLGGGYTAVDSLQAFYQSVLKGWSRPQFTWTVEAPDTIRVQTVTSPTAVKLWQATNPQTRDFRLPTFGPQWRGTTLASESKGVYVAQVSEPPNGWTAFFVELTFDSPGSIPYTFTTQVSVVPDRYFSDPEPDPDPGPGGDPSDPSLGVSARAFPAKGMAPLTVQLAGAAAADGGILFTEWDFGDGGFGVDLATTHTYVQPGTYTARFNAISAAGQSQTATVVIQVEEIPNERPTASLSASAAGGPPPLTVQFTGTGTDSDGQIERYDWDFGDNAHASGQMVEHTFITYGQYNVTLTVTDDRGATATAQFTVNVADAIGPSDGTQPLPGIAETCGPVNGVSLAFTLAGLWGIGLLRRRG